MPDKSDRAVSRAEQAVVREERRLARMRSDQNDRSRKARTHRLIQLGAVLESALGESVDPSVLSAALGMQYQNGRTLSDYVRDAVARNKEG